MLPEYGGLTAATDYFKRLAFLLCRQVKVNFLRDFYRRGRMRSKKMRRAPPALTFPEWHDIGNW